MNHIKTTARMFPKETQKAVTRLLRDQAQSFRHRAVEKISSKYNIHNKGFVKNAAWKVEWPKATTPIDKQQSSASTLRIETPGSGLFTGWEEELTGAPREMRQKDNSQYGRPIWENARKGKSGIVKDIFRMGGNKSEVDDAPDPADYGMPMPQFLAMLSRSPITANGKARIGKNNIFIISGPESFDGWRPGLYRLGEEKINKKKRPKAVMLQGFESTPRNAEKFDWRGEAEADMLKKYTPSYIFKEYLVPVLSKLWKK